MEPGSAGAVVPLDYLGLHSDHGVSHKAPAPTYPYDAIRSHDVDNGHDLPATQWADIEKAPGVYDWRLTDKWIDTHPDKTRIWVLFGTPRFYQKHLGERFVFPHLPGGGSPPRDPRAASFIRALLERYPGKIQFVEIWNEPNNPLHAGRWGRGATCAMATTRMAGFQLCGARTAWRTACNYWAYSKRAEIATKIEHPGTSSEVRDPRSQT